MMTMVLPKKILSLIVSFVLILACPIYAYADEPYTLPAEFDFLSDYLVVPVNFPITTLDYYLAPKTEYPFAGQSGLYGTSNLLDFYDKTSYGNLTPPSGPNSSMLFSDGSIKFLPVNSNTALVSSDTKQVYSCLYRSDQYGYGYVKVLVCVSSLAHFHAYLGNNYKTFTVGATTFLPTFFVCSKTNNWYIGYFANSYSVNATAPRILGPTSFVNTLPRNNLWGYSISSFDSILDGVTLNIPAIYNVYATIDAPSIWDLKLNGNGLLSYGTYSTVFDIVTDNVYGYGNYTIQVLSNGEVISSSDFMFQNADSKSCTVTFEIEESVSLSNIAFRFIVPTTNRTFWLNIASSSYDDTVSGGGSGGGSDLSGIESAIGGVRSDMNKGFNNVSDSVNQASGQISSAVNQAAGQISDSVNQAAGQVSSAVNQAAGQISSSVNQAAGSINKTNESIAAMQESRADQRQDQLLNGLDTSGDNAARESVSAEIESLDALESEILDTISESLSTFEFTSPDTVFTGTLALSLISVKDWLQLLYSSSGDFHIIFIISLSLALALLVVGYYRIQRGG